MPIKITAEIDGIEHIRKNLEVAEKFGMDAMWSLMDEVSKTIIAIMRVYPPPAQSNLPGPRGGLPKYIRKGFEGGVAAAWEYHLDAIPNGVQSLIKNEARDEQGTLYSPYLHSNLYQTPAAREIGWPVLDDVVVRVINALDDSLADTAAELINAIREGTFNEDRIAAMNEISTGDIAAPFN